MGCWVRLVQSSRKPLLRVGATPAASTRQAVAGQHSYLAERCWSPVATYSASQNCTIQPPAHGAIPAASTRVGLVSRQRGYKTAKSSSLAGLLRRLRHGRLLILPRYTTL